VEPLGRSSASLELLLEGCRERVGGVVLLLQASGQLRASVVRELDAELFYDWGGGLVWVGIGADSEDCGASVLRAAVAGQGGGHATLIRGAEGVRAVVNVFEPLAPPLMALFARVKESFDPRRILNPGRMYAGI